MRCLILVLFLFGCIDECEYQCWDGSSVCDLADCPDVCEGYECWDGSCVESENDCVDQPSGEFSIYYNTEIPIAGFQFDLLGVTVNGVSGGDAEANGFSVSSSSTTGTVLGFSLTGSTIPVGEGVLITLDIMGNSNNACLSNVVISDSSGINIPAFIVDCNHLIIGSMVEDFFDYNESNLIAYYFFDQVLINNQQIDISDWVVAFNGDICVGAKQWNCNSPPCELPVYGYNSLNSLTDGYMLFGELPSFKIYDTSNTILHDAIPSSNIIWQDGSFNQIEMLNAE